MTINTWTTSNSILWTSSGTVTSNSTYTVGSNVTFTPIYYKVKRNMKRVVSTRYPYKCGQCLREEKWTMMGITRHWRKCVRDHDNSR